jgi:hypothetical protein
MVATDRNAEMRAVVAKALAVQMPPSEKYGYDLGPALVAGPEGKLITGYLLVVTCRSPVITAPKLAQTYIIPDAWPSDQVLTVGVRECLARLAGRRQQLLTVPAGGNGHQAERATRP